MEFWKEVRRRVLTKEISKRAACETYGLGWHTLTKILAHDEPPGYRQSPGEAEASAIPADHSADSGRRPAGTEEAAAYGQADFPATAGRTRIPGRRDGRQGCGSS